MSADALIENMRVRDAASCRAWLARLAASEASRLSSVDRLLRNLARSTQAPDLVLEIVEQARPAHVAELAGVLERLDATVFPMSDADRGRFSAAAESLRLGRDLYKQIHTQLVDQGEAVTRTRMPGASSRCAP